VGGTAAGTRSFAGPLSVPQRGFISSKLAETWEQGLFQQKLLLEGMLDKPAEEPYESIDVRQGVVRRANGVSALVVWIELSRTEPLQVTIE